MLHFQDKSQKNSGLGTKKFFVPKLILMHFKQVLKISFCYNIVILLTKSQHNKFAIFCDFCRQICLPLTYLLSTEICSKIQWHSAGKGLLFLLLYMDSNST